MTVELNELTRAQEILAAQMLKRAIGHLAYNYECTQMYPPADYFQRSQALAQAIDLLDEKYFLLAKAVN